MQVIQAQQQVLGPGGKAHLRNSLPAQEVWK